MRGCPAVQPPCGVVANQRLRKCVRKDSGQTGRKKRTRHHLPRGLAIKADTCGNPEGEDGVDCVERLRLRVAVLKTRSDDD